MPSPNLHRILLRASVCAALLLLLAGVALLVINELILAHKIAHPSITFFASSYRIPPQRRPIPARWIPQSWTWLRRVNEFVLGKPRTIPVDINTFEIDADLLASETAIGSDLAKLLAQPASALTNEMRVWFLPEPSIRAIQERFQRIAVNRPVQVKPGTEDKTSASFPTTSFYPDVKGPILRVYQSRVDVLPTTRGAGTEVSLAMVTTCSAPGRLGNTFSTNLAVAFRAQLPAGTGLLLLDSRRKQDESVQAALLVTVDRQRRPVAGSAAAALKK